jgi:hypothetical protein
VPPEALEADLVLGSFEERLVLRSPHAAMIRMARARVKALSLPRMLRLALLGPDSHLGSTLCAACPQGPAGCCVAPPEYDFSDLARVVLHGGRDFLLAELAARRLLPAARGLAVKRVRRRDGPTSPREARCVHHGPRGCTIAPELRPETCNYFLCEDTFVEDRAREPAARAAHAALRALYDRWDEELAARIAARYPEGPTWDAGFLDWLGEEGARQREGSMEARGVIGDAMPLAPRRLSAMMPPMSKITLKLKDLTTGNTSFKELPDEDAALAFLRARPEMTDVLGVVFEGLTREQNDRLKAAMRPLGEAEKAAEARLEAEAERAAEAAQAKRAKEEEAARAAHAAAMKNADPKRPMEVRYRYDGSIAPVDPADTRPITDEMRAAIMAWVAERNEWVESRNQVVGEAKMTVWPGELPKKGADRVQSGSFVPVSAPEKKS